MPLITISRGIGCGGMIIARLVSEGLNLELFDDRRLQEEAIKIGVQPENIDEKAPGFFDRLLSKKPEIYLNYLESLIYEVAKRGEGVIIGHGSQMLLREFDCALHVFVYAGEATRVQNLMKHKGLSEDGAIKLIRKSDHERSGFFRFAFHRDWTDPSLYDLMINHEQLGIDTAAKLIMEAARSEQIKSCSMTAGDAMEKLSLKKKVEASLLEHDLNLIMLHIEVPEKGVIEVNGYTESDENKVLAIEAIKGVNGVTKIEGDIGVVHFGHI